MRAPVRSRRFVSSARPVGTRGFTLLEITLALGVFAALMASVYGIVVSATQLSGDLAYSQEKAIQRRAFINLARRAFAELPPGSGLELRSRDSGGGIVQEVVFPPELPVLRFGRADMDPKGEIILRAEERTGGYLTAVLAYRDEAGKDGGDDIMALDLLPDLSAFQWRFLDVGSGEWEEQWEPERGRTRLVELTWEAEDLPRTRIVFTVHPLVDPARGEPERQPDQDDEDEDDEEEESSEDSEEENPGDEEAAARA